MLQLARSRKLIQLRNCVYPLNNQFNCQSTLTRKDELNNDQFSHFNGSLNGQSLNSLTGVQLNRSQLNKASSQLNDYINYFKIRLPEKRIVLNKDRVKEYFGYHEKPSDLKMKNLHFKYDLEKKASKEDLNLFYKYIENSVSVLLIAIIND